MIWWLLPLTLILGCRSSPPTPNPSSVTVMAYNVENLFDTKDDPGKDDETYLPLSAKAEPSLKKACAKIPIPHYRIACYKTDWTHEKLIIKMQRLAQVILSVNQGRGPDVLILEEVENLAVLEQLRTQYLAKAGYKPAILLEGPDRRGIDVGMLSRLPQTAPPKLHIVSLKAQKGLKKNRIHPTRGILQATFSLPDKTNLHVFGVHFPSQGSPSQARLQAVARLNQLQQNLPEADLVIAGGDFNITKREDQKIYVESLGPQWLISHKLGCSNCKGTHNYRGHWSFLDALLFSKNLAPEAKGPWLVDAKSIRVESLVKVQVQKRKNIPARFLDGKKERGVSDHWPIVAEIRRKD